MVLPRRILRATWTDLPETREVRPALHEPARAQRLGSNLARTFSQDQAPYSLSVGNMVS